MPRPPRRRRAGRPGRRGRSRSRRDTRRRRRPRSPWVRTGVNSMSAPWRIVVWVERVARLHLVAVHERDDRDWAPRPRARQPGRGPGSPRGRSCRRHPTTRAGRPSSRRAWPTGCRPARASQVAWLRSSMLRRSTRSARDDVGASGGGGAGSIGGSGRARTGRLRVKGRGGHARMLHRTPIWLRRQRRAPAGAQDPRRRYRIRSE